MINNLLHKLNKRKKEGTHRKLEFFEEGIDFFSNDYLGLSKSQEDFSLSGSTGSRLLSGDCVEAHKCENSLADFFEAQSALVYTSGYSANIGLISCLSSRHDLVLYDEKIHASIRDGIKLSQAKSFSFKHNDLKDLHRQLQSNNYENIYVIIESLYSMTGSFSDLKEIFKLTQQYNANLIVDEAHSIGVFGMQGKGLCHHYNIHDKVFARVITFGKAYGLMGAAVLASQTTIDFLVNFSRSFIYTTALPSNIYKSIYNRVYSVKLIDRIDKLNLNLNYFRNNFNHANLISAETSPIQMLQIGDKHKVCLLSSELLNNGIICKPIFYPTVPENEESIRLCFHSFNTIKEIDFLLKCLNRVL